MCDLKASNHNEIKRKSPKRIRHKRSSRTSLKYFRKYN